MTQPVRLVLLRHGQSEWNAAGIFAGWENAHPTAHGEAEAALRWAIHQAKLTGGKLKINAVVRHVPAAIFGAGHISP